MMMTVSTAVPAAAGEAVGAELYEAENYYEENEPEAGAYYEEEEPEAENTAAYPDDEADITEENDRGVDEA
ncbi:MAG: hypothetical protein Q4B09_11595 [Lachnospiraceae bacterium]|nr:hypothetical protein [Lachnospiraceae bacterium]